jgi:alkylation response protein AidB-like acyl-CoA dehydrogenase
MTMMAPNVKSDSDYESVVAGAWPALVDIASASPARLWSALHSAGLAVPNSLESLIVAQRALGATAAPAPVADAWALRELLGDHRLSDESVVPALATPKSIQGGVIFPSEFGSIVTHIVCVEPNGHVTVALVAGREDAPGMAMPSWQRLTLGEVVLETEVAPELADRVVSRVRFALAARAFAAAEATHRLAVEHGGSRMQFGKHIGSYQAVQHRTVNCAIEVALATALVDDAVRLDGLEDPTTGLALEMAVFHTLDRASWVQFEAHHTLAASGFFDLYPAPWLFRRVQADVARIPLFERAAGGVADEMIETDTRFPSANLGEAAEAFREELRALFAQWQPEMGSGRQADVSPDVVAGLREHGLITLDWPEQFGGAGKGIDERAVLSEEVGLKKLRTGSALGAGTLIGRALMNFGTREQQAKYLPLIRDADLDFYLGYSEPDVGSDLASLQLSAVRDGDEWVLNGVKRWGQAQRVKWGWIAARTNTEAQPRHAGISVFLVPLHEVEGFWVEEITSLAGETHAFSHFDNVRVQADSLIGEVDGGWKIITAALADERITMAGFAAGTRGLLELLLDELSSRGELPARGSHERHRLGRVATRLQGTRVLTARGIAAQAAGVRGGAAALEAPLAKIVSGETTEEFSQLAVDLLGAASMLDEGAPGSIARGLFDYSLRVCLIGTVGGGTGDIQRNILARALGLPKD